MHLKHLKQRHGFLLIVGVPMKKAIFANIIMNVRQIIDANHELTHRLSRAINSQNLTNKKALGELFASIKANAFRFAEKEFTLDPPLEIEIKAILNFPQARTFTLPPLEQNFAPIESFDEASSHDLIVQSRLFSQFFVDENVLMKYHRI